MPCLITHAVVLAHVLIHLGLKRRHQHASSALAHERVQIELEHILFGLFRSDYSQHAAYLSMDGLTAARASTTRRVRRAPHPDPDPQLPVIAPQALRTFHRIHGKRMPASQSVKSFQGLSGASRKFRA